MFPSLKYARCNIIYILYIDGYVFFNLINELLLVFFVCCNNPFVFGGVVPRYEVRQVLVRHWHKIPSFFSSSLKHGICKQSRSHRGTCELGEYLVVLVRIRGTELITMNFLLTTYYTGNINTYYDPFRKGVESPMLQMK